MTDTDSLDLAALLCSRLCHDMLSPVGALNNGLELLEIERDPDMRAKCIELIAQSAATSATKLKFFRLAFGAAGGFGEDVPVEEAHSVIAALVANAKRVELQWALAADRLPKGAVKVLLNFAQIALDALVRGGTLDVGAERRGGTTEIVVRAAAAKVAFDDTIGRALEGRLAPGELTSRTAAAHMLSMLAARAKGRIQYAHTDDALVLGAVLPEG